MPLVEAWFINRGAKHLIHNEWAEKLGNPSARNLLPDLTARPDAAVLPQGR